MNYASMQDQNAIEIDDSDTQSNQNIQFNQVDEITYFGIKNMTSKSIYQCVLLITCAAGTVISGISQGILIPVLTLYFPSIYFMVFAVSLEILIIYTAIMLLFEKILKTELFSLPKNKLLIFITGLFCAAMSIAKIYSSNPNRTPPIMQSSFQSATIIFTFVFSNVILGEWSCTCGTLDIRNIKFANASNRIYTWKYIIISIICLATSIAMPLTYDLIVDKFSDTYHWAMLYCGGIICRAIYTVLQEYYFLKTNDISLGSKIKLLFYVNLVTFIAVIPAFGLEFVIGESNFPLHDFTNSTIMLFTNSRATILFHGFVIAYFIFLACTIYLNSISSNYVMIISVIITPAVTIFFNLYSGWTPDIVFPTYIIVPSLVLAVISAAFWFFGERKEN